MTAKILNIKKRHRPNQSAWVRLADFEWREGGEISAEYVLKMAQVSLYCLDQPNERFIFVETDPDVDLTQAPFFFQAQFEQALRLIAVPYDSLHQLVDQQTYAAEQLILLYSVGRCGSTLLSDLFNQLETVVSLSEPDIFTELLKMRTEDGRHDALIKRLLKTSLLALMKPLSAKRPLKYAIKFRSYAIELADLIAELFPQAHHLFMYRHAEDWARSTARAFQKLASDKGSVGTANERLWASRSARLHAFGQAVFGEQVAAPFQKIINRVDSRAGVLSRPAMALRAKMFPALRPFIPQLRAGTLSRMEYITLEWLSGLCRFLALQEANIPLLPFRYEELMEQPEAMLKTIFNHCGLPETAVAQGLPVFEKDSQRGTSLARTAVRQHSANDLTEAHLQQLRQLLKQFPQIERPDVILPGTMILTIDD